MSQVNREDTKSDSDDESSASTSVPASANSAESVSSNGSSSSCCTRLSNTTTSTTTNSSKLDAIEDFSVKILETSKKSLADLSPSTVICQSKHSNATNESKVLASTSDEVITRSQSITGRKQLECDKQVNNSSDIINSSGLEKHAITSRFTPTTSEANKSIGINQTANQQPNLVDRKILQTPSPPPPPLAAIDTNNNKDEEKKEFSSGPRVGLSSGIRRTNFSKSASHCRLTLDSNEQHDATSRTTSTVKPPPKVCDCLAANCQEKEHSTRRRFIEHYYNSRTRLPSSSTDAMSSLNISTPLNRLSECDAITKRLLSSPIRGANNLNQSREKRSQINEADKSRRASLGTNTLTEQLSLSSNQFNSLESSYKRSILNPSDGPDDDAGQKDRGLAVSPTSELDIRLKHHQGRSLSVCHEETQKSRFGSSDSSKNSSNRQYNAHYHHSSNLNRAISLACDSGSSRRLLNIIPLFGCDILALEQFMKIGLILPPVIDSAVDHIIANGIKSIGIFRKSGVKSRILTLRQRIESNQDIKVDELISSNEFSIYDIADLVKMWFRELKPTPIMNKDLIRLLSDHLNRMKVSSTESIQSDLEYSSLTISGQDGKELREQIMSAVSPAHRALFSKALGFFSIIASQSETNQMTSQNLAICLTPSLCATGSDQNSIIVAQRALKYCLDNYRILF